VRGAIAEALAKSRLFAGRDAPTFEIEEIPTLGHSYVARVRLLSPESPVPSLIFKCSRAERSAYLTIREARFYRGMAPTLPDGLAPRCFLAEAEGGSATLLLEDLGRSHRACPGTGPSLEQATAFVEALAELHAAGNGVASLPADWARAMGGITYDTIEGRLGLLGPLLRRFIDAMGDGLDPQALRLIAGIHSGSARLAGFAGEHSILHGDAHYGNGLYAPGRAVLLDWGNTCLGPGEIDLAHAVALNLPREIGRNWEAALLESYCQRLNEPGVSRSLEDIRARYLLGVLYAVTVPIGHWSAGLPEKTWRRLFENVLAAAGELKVESLL
jgi:aminoglycoside phosphotransferase (APT) family kinase protein